MESLLTTKELAELLNVSEGWVYERTRLDGRLQLPHLKVGKYLRFRASEVIEFLERSKESSPTN